jgi:very-short-patch-repair endonuclease
MTETPSPLAGEGRGEGVNVAASIKIARSLRRRMTDAEQALWQKLRNRRLEGHRFKRQVPLGSYIVDFICFEARLIVELDGGQHAENSADEVRTDWLQSQGFVVVRYWNNEALANIDGVLSDLLTKLSSRRGG